MNSRLLRLVSLLVVLSLLFPGGAWNFEAGKGLKSTALAPKSLETYWAEADLNEFDLIRFLADQNCLQSQRHFLACVNSVSSMAERLRLRFTRDGKFTDLTAEDMERRLSEKMDLAEWRNAFDGPDFEPGFSFPELWTRLKSELKDETKINSLLANGINAYLSVANDPHTYIVPLAYYEEVLSQSESRIPHLGFVARRVKGGAVVRKVFTDSPAARSGLRKGDRILELNGAAVSRLHSAEFAELIRGQSSGRLLLTIERAEQGKKTRRALEIIQGETKLISVESRVLQTPARLGLLTIHKFARETCQNVRKHLVALIEQSIEGLLLDLRDNPGGQVDEAACVTGLFLEPGIAIFHTKYLDPLRNGEMYWSEGPQLYDGPIAVLVNSGSASASEIVAGALKDLSRATLVGERTFGKGSFQDGMLWRTHSQVALFQTQGFYYFASGWTPQIVGLEPDLPVRLSDSDIGSESMREADLYLLPLRPLDLWTGPQSLAWLNDQKCNEPMIAELNEDAQIQKALDWVRCSEKSKKTSGLPGL